MVGQPNFVPLEEQASQICELAEPWQASQKLVPLQGTSGGQPNLHQLAEGWQAGKNMPHLAERWRACKSCADCG